MFVVGECASSGLELALSATSSGVCFGRLRHVTHGMAAESEVVVVGVRVEDVRFIHPCWRQWCTLLLVPVPKKKEEKSDRKC